jgi:ATP-dependent helicase HrpB
MRIAVAVAKAMAEHRYIVILMASDPTLHSVLPIEDVLPELRAALSKSASAVLQAPPGAGKTTGVPLALLTEPWLQGRRILMLEPRRLATRAAARRMASMLGESVGRTVGFRVRGETRVGPATRIEVVTEGVLTRMLLDDATLEQVGIVVFDEFHERSLNADVGLALTLQTQALLRPDLRIVVMSATLDDAAIAGLLGGASVIRSTGRIHPVEIRYLASRPGARIEDSVAGAIRSALASDMGSILAFLPGAGEIRRCIAALERSSLPGDVRLLPLYGDLSPTAQDAAIAPSPFGVRKVVIATSIAETSLTIEGVRVVIDSGVSRVSRFSPRTGMSRLETVRVSRSSADQRTGRAGRTAPGVSYRLWAPEEDSHLPDRARPEILEADLAPLTLDLAAAGVVDPSELRWLDAPPGAALAQARELLRQLGALTAEHRITNHGRTMASLGLHPRLSHMLLAAQALGHGATGCAIAALLEERDVLRRDTLLRDVDLRSRVAILADGAREIGAVVDRDALRRVQEQAHVWRAQLRVPATERIDEGVTGLLLAFAYPERVAQRRAGDGDRYLMRSGAGAVLDDPGVLAGAPHLVIADLDGRSPQSRIYLAAPLDRVDLDEAFAADVEREDVISWDPSAGSVVAVRRERLGAIVLREGPLRDVDADAVASVVLDAIVRNDGLSLRWSDAARQLRERVAFLRSLDALWPDFTELALLTTADEWLRPHLTGVRRRADVEHLDLSDILRGLLTWEQRRRLDELAPTHVVVPTGSRIAVDYTNSSAPSIAVRLQELFGLADTPRIAGGVVAITLHLLSPAHRPVQVTRDLAGFWRSSYFDVRKDLRGRYPKHEWPEDPMSATPTKRAKRRAE